MSRRIEEIILKVSLNTDRANQQLDQFMSRAKRAGDQLGRFGNQQDKIQKQMKNRPPSDFWAKWVLGQNKAINSSDKLDQSVNKTNSSLLKIGAAVGGAIAIKSLGAEALSVAVKFDRIDNSLKTVFGSTAKAQQEFEGIRKEADRLGLDLGKAADGYIKIAAASRGTKMEGQATKDIFLGVAEASTALSLSGEQSNGALLAISQIMSKGKVQAEELRGQLGERIPGAFQIAARAMGVTTMELDKMMERGELVSEDFLPKFANQLRTEFAGPAVDASNSIAAAQNRLRNEWERSLRGIGDAAGSFIPILAKMLKMTNDFMGSVGEVVDGLNIWRDQLLGIQDDFSKGFTEEQKEQFRLNKARAEEAKKLAVAAKDEAKEQEKISAALKKSQQLSNMINTLFADRDAKALAKEMGLSAKETEALMPAIKDAFLKGADEEQIKQRITTITRFFKKELNEVKATFEKISGTDSPFNSMIKDATLLKRALDLRETLGLSKKEFEKVGGTIGKALLKGMSPEGIKANLEGLRELGFFKEDKAKGLTGPQANVFQAGTAAASEFLKGIQTDIEQLDALKKIEKNTSKGKQVTLVAK